jgi:hypothetical protein
MSFSSVSSSAPASKTSPIFITPRSQVLSTLKTGEQLTVRVLDLIGDKGVLLQVKGTPVTAKNLGQATVGQSLQVVVETDGKNVILRRMDQTAVSSDSLKSVVRFGVARNLISSEVLTGFADLIRSEKMAGLPETITRGVQLAADLMQEVPKAETVERLFALFGLKDGQWSQRLFFENSTSSVYAAVSRLLRMPSAKIRALLVKAGFEDLDFIKELLQKAAIFKRSVEVFRAGNGLSERLNQPLCLPIPYGPPGERGMAQIFWNEKKEGEEGRQKRSFTIYMRLRFSRLGEVRSLIRKDEDQVDIQLFLEEGVLSDVQKRMDLLGDALDSVGVKASLSVMNKNALDDPDLSFPEHLMGLAGGSEGLSVRA